MVTTLQGQMTELCDYGNGKMLQSRDNPAIFNPSESHSYPIPVSKLTDLCL